jgi:hypothetical protein
MKTTNNGQIEIRTPYNREFISDLKESVSGAKWNGEYWTVPEDAESTIDTLLKQHYGYTPDAKKVKIIITAKRDIKEHRDSVYFNGHPIARATGRDSGAKTVNGTIKLNGTITSTGSVKNWYTTIKEGAKFQIEVFERIAISDNDWSVEIIQTEKSKEQIKIENDLCEMILQKYNIELSGCAEITSIAKKILSKSNKCESLKTSDLEKVVDII